MRTMTLSKCAVALLALLALPATALAAEPDGAPKKGTVTFESHLGIPAAGYSLVCPPGIPSCKTDGAIDLTTKTEVPVSYANNLGATYGVAPLPYSATSGSASMSFTCEGKPDPFVSKLSPSSTTAGELEIASVKALPGSNLLSVALNHGGASGNEFPSETYDRSDGGCGAPTSRTSPTMGSWYYNFYMAHREGQQELTNDLELKGLAYNNGAFVKEYERFVNVSNGGTTYPLFEHTKIEVEPEFCEGAQNKISHATGNGQSLGLDGSSLYVGQLITGPPKTHIHFADTSGLEMEKGGTFEVEKCLKNETGIGVPWSIGRIWFHVKKALAGSDDKFNVTTKRTVAGVRGTRFGISYDEKKELTKLWVKEGTVSFKGRNGGKGKIMVHAGQSAMQKGKGSVKFLKR